MTSLFPRHASQDIVDSLTAFRVVIINGPRQSGKSTLLNELLPAAERVTLDDRQMLRAARTDPAGFLDGLRIPLAIDEVQRGGDPLVLAIKATVDRRHTEAGLFVLAGSSRFLTVPHLTESLAGRARIIQLWPLSQGELQRNPVPTMFLDALLGDPSELRSLRPSRITRRDVFQRIVNGGFPAMQRIEQPRLRTAWFDDYVKTLVSRDLTELSRIRQSADLPRLVRLLASRTGEELNVSSVARDLQLGHDALRAYLALLETIYLVFQVPAWATSQTAVARRRPKLHFVDSGVASSLVNATVDSLAHPTSRNLGQLLETFVVSEIARLAEHAPTGVHLGHYRDKAGREVDLIIEARDGRVAGIEVKAAIDVDESDFRHLAYLRDRLGERFVSGVVVHLGERVLSFGDRLTAVPVSALWA